MTSFQLWLAVLGSLLVLGVSPMPPHVQGPVFLQEPPSWLEFSNSTGAMLSCSAHGTPPPEIRWQDSSDKELAHIPRLRELLPNGSLHFAPFPPEDYNPELHAATYRCRATNPAGSIVSRDCKLRADVVQPYQLQVHNVFVMGGNVAVLKCNIPNFVRGLVQVSSWLKDEHLLGRTVIHPGGKFTLTSSGSLHIRDTVTNDGFARFYCQTVHRLTGEKKLSMPGQIIISQPQGNIPPRIEHSIPIVNARAGSPTDLVCAAQGSPPPTYRWYRDQVGVLQEVGLGMVLVRPLQSVLQFPRLQLQDEGRYICVVSKLLGEGIHISWLKDAHPLLESPHVSIMQQGEVLVLRNVQKSDRGMYQCMARSGDESAQGSAELTLGDPAARPTSVTEMLCLGEPPTTYHMAS
ncbi:Down syndrome cell adhesion molecule-like protein Dscam2 isoform X2 [Zootermopsis nevadensis]|uniref:Down syndrome cell adhesion molecule-like protein Dscam2 isoform X2 n=1 Tax=Zootermopsis nevadensis TaxID=136037 RepID=UPI000B8E56A2|nr:Down syndrome cell adhesion molecule-like protein Dscam2 isoform X2 [Zootermopsis nevadensis]